MINISEKEKEQQCKTDEEEPLTEIEKKFFDKIFDDIWKEIAMSEEEQQLNYHSCFLNYPFRKRNIVCKLCSYYSMCLKLKKRKYKGG